jgi:hypothetical protein
MASNQKCLCKFDKIERCFLFFASFAQGYENASNWFGAVSLSEICEEEKIPVKIGRILKSHLTVMPVPPYTVETGPLPDER